MLFIVLTCARSLQNIGIFTQKNLVLYHWLLFQFKTCMNKVFYLTFSLQKEVFNCVLWIWYSFNFLTLKSKFKSMFYLSVICDVVL